MLWIDGCSDPLEQWSPNFLAPRTSFVEDNFSMDLGWGADGFRMIQVHYTYCVLYFYDYYIIIYNEIIMELTINAESVGSSDIYFLFILARVSMWAYQNCD